MAQDARNPWLHRFAIFAVLSTLCLIGIGGVVTSTGSGMTVPDWPNSYGYNMFLFPISLWEGGIFYEHSHRLVASFVGFLTIILAVWCQFAPGVGKLTRRLAWAALALVIFQGVLGGLRVTMIEKQIGIFHAVIAQCFLVLLGAIAYLTSALPKRPVSSATSSTASRAVGTILGLFAVLMVLQLAMGATMRHQHEGLAVTTFPDAYGKVFPDISDKAIADLNFEREQFQEIKPVSRINILAHMGHRFLAYFLLIAATAFVSVMAARGTFRRAGVPVWAPAAWCTLLWGQGLLGVVTILKNKPADIATGHVVLGAMTLLAASIMAMHCISQSMRCRKAALTSHSEITQDKPVNNSEPLSTTV